jgi:CubicO group peptidase (beta-lactamase class C family)
MTGIAQDVDPSAVGLDASRLERITANYDAHVDAGHLAGWLCAVGRDGKVAWVGSGGQRDLAQGLEVTTDTIWRIYSMSKPITSIAAMILFEEGQFDLNESIATWLPEFGDLQVYVDGPPEAPVTRRADGPIRVWHLLSHTAGLTYGFKWQHPVDAIYRARGYDYDAAPKDVDLAGLVADVATCPLVFTPGEAWNYSYATDVLGRLIEVWSGMPLDEFLQARIFDPLGMTDTGFFCPEADQHRLAELYLYGEGGALTPGGRLSSVARRKPRILGGGGGLVSSARDYHRFCTMLVRGGVLDGVRVVAPSTIELMSSNHLPGDADLLHAAVDNYAEASNAGLGFGLGWTVVIDRADTKLAASDGSISWGGAASTTFWVDPAEDLTCVFFTQLMPTGIYNVHRELQRAVYQAVVD